MYRVIQITDLNDPKVAQAVIVHFDAFSNNIVANALVGGREELRKQLSEACIRAGIVGGKFYAAVNEDEEVVGVAVWYPPGSDFLSDEEQQKQGAGELLATIAKVDPPLYSWWMNVLLPSNVATSNKYLGEGAKMRSWSLYSVGVAPKYHRTGIAKLLVKVGQDQAAMQGETVCTEATDDKILAICERYGFTMVGYDYVEGPPNAPGYNFYCLTKTPAQPVAER